MCRCLNGLTLHGWQRKLLRNLGVPDLARLLQRHTPHQLGQVGAARDGAAATKRLELDIRDGVVVGVDLDLQLHHIATRRRTDKAGADVCVVLLHAADIAGVVVMVQHLLVIAAPLTGLLDGGGGCAGELGGRGAGGGADGLAGLRRSGGEDSLEHGRLICSCLWRC